MSVTLELQYGDWVLQSDGSFSLVSGAAKGRQDLAEALKNNYDSENPSWFTGSELWKIDSNPTFIVKSGIGVELLIHKYVEEAVRRLVDLQDADAFVDPQEHIIEIRTLKVVKIGKMSYAFFLKVIVDSDDELDLAFKINLIPELPEGMAQSLAQGTELNPDIMKTFL